MGATEPAGHGVAAEPDRVPTRLVLRFAVALAVLSVVAMLLMAALFKLLEGGAVRRDSAAVRAAGLERRQVRLPPEPRLQIYGTRDGEQFRRAEASRLSTYGWMDRPAGVLHIPIERAMELIVERGVSPLPPAAAPIPAPVTPASREAKP